MSSTLIKDLEQFLSETGLSAHRAGIVLVKNGRLIDRLRENRRIWPDTETRVRNALRRERIKRGIPVGLCETVGFLDAVVPPSGVPPVNP